MYAALVRANIQGGVTDAQLKNLREQVIPTVSSAPGFVAGYWTEVVDDKGFAFVVFNDEPSAKAAAPLSGADIGEGVTIEYVEFREILGNAGVTVSIGTPRSPEPSPLGRTGPGRSQVPWPVFSDRPGSGDRAHERLRSHHRRA
jgi:hypothetical protein